MSGIRCLKPTQVQEILNISKTEVYRLFNSKDFPSFRLGEKLLRVTEEDFEVWFNAKIKKG